jgi:hypothetical protein
VESCQMRSLSIETRTPRKVEPAFPSSSHITYPSHRRSCRPFWSQKRHKYHLETQIHSLKVGHSSGSRSVDNDLFWQRNGNQSHKLPC